MSGGCAPGGPGSAGPAGPSILVSAAAGKAAANGTPKIQQVAQPDLPMAPPPLWLSAVFQDIQRQYINAFGNGSPDDCIARLVWLQKIVSVGRQAAIQSSPQKAALAAYDSMTLSIKSLTSNIGLGLDVYGRAQNYVSLIAPDVIQTLLDSQLNDLDKIQAARDAIARKQNVQSDGLSQLNTATDQLNASIVQAQSDLAIAAQRVGELEDEISAGLADLGELWAQLGSSDQTFRKAVEAQAGGNCDFSSIMQCAAIVATVVGTGGAGIALVGAAASAYKGLQQINSKAAADPGFSFANIESQFHQIGKDFQPVGSDVDNLKKAYQGIKPALDKLNDTPTPAAGVPGIPSDYAKLVAAKADFDKAVQPYLDLPQAQQYESLMNRFVAVAETRNNKIVEHDATVAKINSIYSTIATRQAGVEQLATITQSTFDASVDQNVNFMDGQLDAIKVSLIRQITDMAKAIQYSTLHKPTISLGDYSPGALRAVTTQIKSDYYSAMGQIGQAPATADHITIPLTSILVGKSWNDFVAGKPVVIAIPSGAKNDPFKSWYGTQTVALTLARSDGTLIPNNIQFQFQHQGRSLIYDIKRTPTVFSHTASVTGLFQHNAAGVMVSDGTLLGDNKRWLGVSPYGPWRIVVQTDTPAGVQALSQAVLTFKICGQVAPIQ